MQFVTIDMDSARPSGQQQLVKKYYQGYIPHVVVLDARGAPVYNQGGEVSESEISRLLDGLLDAPSK